MGDAGVIPTPVALTRRFVDLHICKRREFNQCLVKIGSLKADAPLIASLVEQYCALSKATGEFMRFALKQLAVVAPNVKSNKHRGVVHESE